MESIINVSNLSYLVKGITIIDNVSFAVKKGDVFALIGHNGAGKTTLIELILNDLKPSKGEIKLFGTLKYNFYNVGVLYDKLPLFPLLKVYEIIHYFACIRHLNYKDIEKSYFHLFEIDKIRNSFIKELSQGEQKKLSLLIAIMHNPELLILDEPFSNIDPTSKDLIWKILKNGDRTILFTTHNWIDAEKNANMIGFIRNGKLLLPPQSAKNILNLLPSRKKLTITASNAKKIKHENLNYYEYDGEMHIFLNDEQKILKLIQTMTVNYSIMEVSLIDAYLFYSNILK